MANRKSLTEAYHRLTSITMNNAGQIASDNFLNLGSWREDDIQRYIEKVIPGMDNAKRTMANYTSGYYGKIAAAEKQTFSAVSVPATKMVTESLRNGTTAEMIWQRPFKEMWTQLSKGTDFSEALKAGARRADWTARTEVQLAKRQAGLTVRDGNKNIVGYLRTLTGAENCGLCYLASTQRYHRGDLLPIHPGCDCGETPIFGNTDVGQIVDEQTLDATHEAVAERFGKFDASGRAIDYRKITIVDHGELGPYLTVKGHEFTKVKPEVLKAAIKPPKPVSEAMRVTFAERIQPKLAKFNGATIMDDIKAEHGNVYVPGLKGKAKIQKLGEKTQAHLNSVKAIGAELDKEIDNRVKAAIKDIATKEQIEYSTKMLKSAEDLLTKTKLEYEAGYQKYLITTQARLEAEALAKRQKLLADGLAKTDVDAYMDNHFSKEAILRRAQGLTEQEFRWTDVGRRLRNDIDEYQKDIILYQKNVPEYVVPGTERYNKIFAEKAQEVLSEVRDLGKGGPVFAGSTKVNNILDKAKQVYPSSWLEKAAEKYPSITTKEVRRGYWQHYRRELAVSFDKAQGFEHGLSTAVHEMGHMFEYSVPGLKQLEFAFAHERAALNPKRANFSSNEKGFEDNWRMLYTGKDYGYGVDDAYEIFTTGIESVFAGSNHWLPPKGYGSIYKNASLPNDIPIDDEFRQFILGVLFTL